MSLTGALDGVRVVAVEQAVSLPYCSFVLAELGADVIKVERLDGDVIRNWDHTVRGLSTGYVWVNANKRSLTVDIQTPEGQAIIRDLSKSADVFLENFTPGAMARCGLDAPTLRSENSRLIYCSLSGYGQDGPYRDTKAYDLLVQGEAGVLATTGYPDAPAKVGIPLVDLAAGANAAVGVMVALYRRATTGEGAYLDIAMFESIVNWLGYFPHHYWHTGQELPRTGMRHQFICPYGPYQAKDGKYVNVSVANEEDWRRFCLNVVERPEWLADSRFDSIEARLRHRSELEAMVEAAIVAENHDHWLVRLSAASLPYGEVRNIREVLDHPQLVARTVVVEADSPVGRIPMVRYPLADASVTRRIPGLGEHTGDILAELGYDFAKIASLRERRVV